MGQLGHSDFVPRSTPQRVRQLEGKKVTSIGLGEDFCIALGLTLPQHEYAKLAAQNGVLKQKSSKEDRGNRPNIKRIKSSTQGKSLPPTNFGQVMSQS